MQSRLPEENSARGPKVNISSAHRKHRRTVGLSKRHLGKNLLTVLLLTIVMTTAINCTRLFTEEPTPRPIYTPYPTALPAQTPTPRPTYTPYPIAIPAQTATLIPTHTFYPTAIPTQVPTLRPTYTPGSTQITVQAKNIQDGRFILESGPAEPFKEQASAALQRGKKLFKEGEYEASAIAFKEAQEHHGKPSAVLESLIGSSYSALQLHDLAIQHRSNSIAIKDRAGQRTNRALSYLANGQCEPAVADAQIALSMEPEREENFHTDVEANYILAACYHQAEGDHHLALQHIEASLAIAKEHQNPQAKLTYLAELRDAIQTALDGTFSTEYFFGPSDIAVDKARKLLNDGQYQAAIMAFIKAQQLIGRPSPNLENAIAVSYEALGQYGRAIQHYSNAITIVDNPLLRTQRAGSHLANGECEPAIADAQLALTMEPESDEGFHTDVDANYILAACYHQAEGNHQLALQHTEASLAIAKEHQIPQPELIYLDELRDAILTALDAEFPSEYFVGPAKISTDRGNELFYDGQYEAAIAAFTDAQQLHSKPSAVLKHWIALSYEALGQYDLAIQHYSDAITIVDNPILRTQRAGSHLGNGECEPAIADAQVALTMDPESEEGFHTDTDANWILAFCYETQSKFQLAMQHADEALAIATEHQYTEESIALLTTLRETIQTRIDTEN